MAYAALVSLKITIERLLNSSRISIVPNPCPHIENLCNEVDSLLEFLQRKSTLEISSSCSSRERVIADDLERRTVEAVYKLEDGLESHVSSQILSHCESTGDLESYPLRFTIDLQKVEGDIDSFTETVKQIKEDYRTQILNDDDVSSRIDLGRSVLAYDSLISLISLIKNRKYELVYKELASLQLLLERSISSSGSMISRRSQKAIADLDSQIREATRKFTDVLEVHGYRSIAHFKDLEQKCYLLATKLSKIKEECNTQVLELSKPSVQDNNINVVVSSRINFGRSEKERSEMACAALISLMKKIENIYYSKSSIVPRCPKIELVYKDFGSLQVLVERSSKRSQEVIANLDRQIREATSKLEKALELYQNAASQLTSEDESCFLTDLQGLEQEIDLFTTSVTKIKEEYTTMDCSKIIGLQDEMKKLKDRLISDDAHHVVSIVGMVGIGKTTLARHVYEDPLILSHFQRRAWVTIGHKYQFEKIMSDLLDQLTPGIHDDDISGTWIQQDFNPLYNSLSFKRYLIVFDDIWESEVWHMFKKFFPGNRNGSKIMLTTRHEADYSAPTRIAYTHRMQFPWSIYMHTIYMHKMRFLNNEESWHMFCEKVFAENSCPLELEKAAKKIVQNCEGLPLAIIILAKHLSKSEKTLEYWTNVAEKRIPVFDTADELEVILSSYKYLPLQLKACFLYMGVFPQDSKISVSKLIKLWCVEGLFEPSVSELINLEHTANDCLEGLVSNSLVMVRKRSSNGGTKTCGIHYIFQHLLLSEASKCKFFHVINRYASGPAEAIKGHRRICIHNNVLFGIKDVHESMVSISTVVRSLLCTGQHHQYPVPMCSNLSLLRVLDALTIRFYNFPFEILKLFRLRYLAFTYCGELPPSISKLWDLQYLIVRKHLSIKHGGGPSYLPMEIWEMKELKHLQVMGCDLLDPCGGSLPNLLTLLDVSFDSCTEEVLKGIPNLRKLGIQIEIPLDVPEPFYWPNDLSHLDKLESLKCIIVNPPNHTSRVVAPLPPFPTLSSSLRKLSLSGFGYPWEHLSQIYGYVPFLCILKLRNYAFRGPKWSTYAWFYSLKFLLIEDTDLEFWEGSIPRVTHLTLRHCYKLKTIPACWEDLEMMELVDCNPSAAEQAEMITSERDFSRSVHFSG